MTKPKTIRIFLLDGSPTGTKTAEISNWTGKAYVIPRNRLKNSLKDKESKDELDSQCVYLLMGADEDDRDVVYVGEAECFIKRIEQHNRTKDFWNIAVCFISKDENLTKAHVKYLESSISRKINDLGRIKLKNSNLPPMPRLPRSDIAEMEEFLSNTIMLLSTLGYRFLEDIAGSNDKKLFYCEGRGIKAKGKLTDEGFVVLKGSEIAGTETKSLSSSLKKKRELNLGYLRGGNTYSKLSNGNYQVLKDVLFNSPSAASGFVLGRSSNGWEAWKLRNGQTLHELERDE